MHNRIKWGHICSLLLLPIVMGGSRVDAASDESISSGTLKYLGSDWETPPIDPEKPKNEVEPGGEIVKTEGLLRLDLVPQFIFGPQAVSTEDQVYYSNAQLFKGDTPARANYIQLSDNRGSLEGWQLTVRQETQFMNEHAQTKELSGAVLSFDKQWGNSTTNQEYQPTIVKDAIKISEIGATYPIAIAGKGKGSGTWTIEFGSSGSVEGIENTLTPVINADGKPVTDPTVEDKPMYKNSAVALFVPGQIAKDPVKYSTTLTWTIAVL